MTMKTIRRQIGTVNRLQAISENEDLWADVPGTLDNGMIDDAGDAEYRAFWQAAEELARMIVKFTGGRIAQNIAMRMAIHKRPELSNLLARAGC